MNSGSPLSVPLSLATAGVLENRQRVPVCPEMSSLGARVHPTAAFCCPTGLTLFPGVNKETMQGMLVYFRTQSVQGDLPRSTPNPCTQQFLEARGSSPARAELREGRQASYLQPAVGSALPVSWSALPPAPPRTKLTPGQRAWILGTGLQDLDKIGSKLKTEYFHSRHANSVSPPGGCCVSQ